GKQVREGAGQTAYRIHQYQPPCTECVLTSHTEDVERDAIAEEMVESPVKHGGADHAPVFARQHAIAHEGARVHDPILRMERTGRELPGKHRDECRTECAR